MAKTINIKPKAAQDKKNQLAESVSKLLADTYTLYLQTQNFHWNVKGMNFSELHLLFESQYQELADAVDTIAERIRALAKMAPGTYKEFSQLSDITQVVGDISAEKMIKHLVKCHQIIVATAQMVCDNAEACNDQVSLDLATSRLAVHEKILWMLNSTIDGK